MSDIDNGQHWLDRNRPPRVQITYDVEIGDAVEKKELPLVVGILAHLGRGDKDVAPLSLRKFAPVDRDNFDELLNGIAPSIMIKDVGQVTFTSMKQFHPLGLLEHPDLPDLQELYHERQKLRDMLGKLDGNEKMEFELQKFIDKQELAKNGKPVAEPISAAQLQQAIAQLRLSTEALKAKVALHEALEKELVAATADQTSALAKAAEAKTKVDEKRALAKTAAEALPAADAPDSPETKKANEAAAAAAEELSVALSAQEKSDKEVIVAQQAVEAATKKRDKAKEDVAKAGAANAAVAATIKAASADPAA